MDENILLLERRRTKVKIKIDAELRVGENILARDNFLSREMFAHDFGSAKREYIEGPFPRDKKGEESLVAFDSAKVEQFNYISYTGVKLKKPFITVRWYGRLIHFKDLEETRLFMDWRFREREFDTCPVCGEMKGRHLRILFMAGTGLPYNPYFCSKECQQEFMHNIHLYKKLFKNV